ncbi:copper amine oxidase N-terminal domain-containing protein [Paenibacillus sp.]|uniref:copper amine oxidase N-terminal domain-containing protein n=1 Tax=Paenibacillus sp. TaxID=58172 RepID=UPI002D64C5E4|nr:copper amine oxidase N-terminal domain-containing protein [Paenibacillus sp.]HZG57014.1 copper amine oxidase N-terminal domain-containing protein [Paenibacillus sp.]
MRKHYLIIVAAAALLWSAGSAVASAASGVGVEVELTIGSSEAVVGGQKLQVKPPVLANGSTLVPLRVISAAFASDPEWIPETQGIVLVYGGQRIELHIGSVVSKVNGEARTIPSAPQLIDGTTMVPVRFISETFGADVQFTESDGAQTIRITGDLAASGSEDGEVLLGDEGKTRIGDSHWGWSMDYPSGLVEDYQALNGEWIYFSDANGEYGIDITVDTTQPNLKASGLLAELREYIYGGTITDERLVTTGDAPYAKIVSRTSGGTYLEDRLYLKDGVLYLYSFEVYAEANYKNEAKMKVYQALIDSFRPTYDAGDTGMKDVSAIKGGYIVHTDELYGISLELPADWTAESDATSLSFYSPDYAFSLYFAMSSKEEGDTLEKWAQRHESRFAQELLPPYREIAKLPGRTVDGADALVRRWSETLEGEWTDTYDIYVIKGEYKYNFSFFYDKANRTANEETIGRIVDSIRLDADVASENFGYLRDTYDIDMWATETYDNDTYGYSIAVPAYWEESYYSTEESAIFEYRGGTLTIEADTLSTFEEVTAFEEEYIEYYKEYDEYVVVAENAIVAFKGAQAKKIVIDTTAEGAGALRTTTYVLEKNGTVFTVRIDEYKNALTPENEKRMKAAIDSLVFR